MLQTTLDEVLSRIEDVPSVSYIAIEMLNLIDEPYTTRADIADLIALDEALCAKTFRFANSLVFGYKRRINKLEDAVSVLGFDQIKQLGFLVASQRLFMDLESWHESVYIAYTASRFARELRMSKEEADNIYMAGLMMSYGKLVFKYFYKTIHDEITRDKDLYECLEIEKKAFQVNHLELSVDALWRQGFPQEILQIIYGQMHYDNQELFTQKNALIELARLTREYEYFSADEIDAELEKEKIQNLIDGSSLQGLKLTGKTIRDIHLKVHELMNI